MRLSIITINYNNKIGLEKTIESVINQTYTDFEYIVIDGGSTDDSADLIKKNSNKIKYWISEKDTGVYNAMNKGIKQAKGNYLVFLNSGDYFTDNDVLNDLSKSCKNTDIVFGDIKYTSEHSEFISYSPDKITFSFFLQHSLPHPCTAIHRSLFEKYGYYKEDIKIAADWVFFLDMICKNNASYKHINRVISNFLIGGLSSDIEKVKIEKHDYLIDNYSAFYYEYLNLLNIKEKNEILIRSRLIKFIVNMLHYKYKKLL